MMVTNLIGKFPSCLWLLYDRSGSFQLSGTHLRLGRKNVTYIHTKNTIAKLFYNLSIGMKCPN